MRLALCTLVVLGLSACRGDTAPIAPEPIAPEPIAPEPIAPEPIVPEPLSFVDHGPAAPTLLLLAGLKGHVEPCGCTAGLHLGGLDRVVGFVREAGPTQPHYAVLDAGNMLFSDPSLSHDLVAQSRARAPLFAAAHLRMGTSVTTPGPNDLALGLDFYLDTVSRSGMQVASNNLRSADGQPLGQDHLVITLGDEHIGVLGTADPAAFAETGDVVVSEPVAATRSSLERLAASRVDTVVVLFQGTADGAAALAEGVPGIDFIVVGQPEETDQVAVVNGAAILHAYDQGRFVGVLKLYTGPTEDYVDARVEDRDTIQRIDRRLDYLRGQLALLPPAQQGDEPDIMLTMRAQVEDLVSERARARNANLQFPSDRRSFLYWPVPVDPGYPSDPEVHASIDAVDAQLHALNASQTEIAPLGDGDIAFAGAETCRSCHLPAYDQWAATPHGHAMQTLAAVGKDFDVVCVSCHVTGFRQPGGSVTGNHNGLSNVQCESCHGPGARHNADPTGHIILNPAPTSCTLCHNREHSPDFSYERYRPLVLGPGHGEEQ